MPKKASDDLSREGGEPSQRTDKGLTIPVPERSEFFGGLEKAAKKAGQPEESAKGKRRTPRG